MDAQEAVTLAQAVPAQASAPARDPYRAYTGVGGKRECAHGGEVAFGTRASTGVPYLIHVTRAGKSVGVPVSAIIDAGFVPAPAPAPEPESKPAPAKGKGKPASK